MIKNPEKYWKERYKNQGDLTPGYCGHNAEEQEEEYRIKKEFIKKYLPDLENTTVVEFGCGTGRMSDLFKYYHGVDFEFVIGMPVFMYEENGINGEIAYGMGGVNSFWDNPLHDGEALFTSTVLQHNTNELIEKLFKHSQNAAMWILYEATTESGYHYSNSGHCAARSVYEYQKLAKPYKKLSKAFKHKVHGSEHSLMIFE